MKLDDGVIFEEGRVGFLSSTSLLFCHREPESGDSPFIHP